MKLLVQRTKIEKVLDDFNWIYASHLTGRGSNAKPHMAVKRKLQALDLSTATEEVVKEALEGPLFTEKEALDWITYKCDECETYGHRMVLEIGVVSNAMGAHSVQVCKHCMHTLYKELAGILELEAPKPAVIESTDMVKFDWDTKPKKDKKDKKDKKFKSTVAPSKVAQGTFKTALDNLVGEIGLSPDCVE